MSEGTIVVTGQKHPFPGRAIFGALTFEWCGGRKDVGVFILDGDNQVQASCCFRDGKVRHQSGDPAYGRIAD
jgi:hypothetical protein